MAWIVRLMFFNLENYSLSLPLFVLQDSLVKIKIKQASSNSIHFTFVYFVISYDEHLFWLRKVIWKKQRPLAPEAIWMK